MTRGFKRGKGREAVRLLIEQIDDGTLSADEVAEQAGCTRSYVWHIRRYERARDPGAGAKRCQRCEFLEDEARPVGKDGLCLWCRMELAGEDLRGFCESGAWQVALDVEAVGAAMAERLDGRYR